MLTKKTAKKGAGRATRASVNKEMMRRRIATKYAIGLVFRAPRSVIAGTVVHGAFRKRKYARHFGLLAGEGAALFTACGWAAGMVSVLFAVDPLEQDVEQEVTSENAKREEYGKRHEGLTRAGVNA